MSDQRNEIYAVHYKGQLLASSNNAAGNPSYGSNRKGRVYTTIGPAKAFISRKAKWLKTQGREMEINDYEVVRYVPALLRFS